MMQDDSTLDCKFGVIDAVLHNGKLWPMLRCFNPEYRAARVQLGAIKGKDELFCRGENCGFYSKKEQRT
jgi:hypothetical protein